MKGLLGFLFGRDAEIFDEKGEVRHQFPNQKWDAWKHRFSQNPEYDWHHHSGTDEDKSRPKAKNTARH